MPDLKALDARKAVLMFEGRVLKDFNATRWAHLGDGVCVELSDHPLCLTISTSDFSSGENKIILNDQQQQALLRFLGLPTSDEEGIPKNGP